MVWKDDEKIQKELFETNYGWFFSDYMKYIYELTDSKYFEDRYYIDAFDTEFQMFENTNDFREIFFNYTVNENNLFDVI